MLNLTLFEIILISLAAALIAALAVILWWHLAGERVKALIAGWLALPLLWKIVLPVVFGAFVLHGSVKSNESVANVVSVANPNFQLSTGNIGIDNWQHSHNGNIQQENSTLQLQLTTTTITPSLLQSSTVSLGLFRTTGFEVDTANKILEFSVAWDDDLFDCTLSRNLFFYSSTNLLERRWTWFNTYSMPEGTNGYSI